MGVRAGGGFEMFHVKHMPTAHTTAKWCAVRCPENGRSAFADRERGRVGAVSEARSLGTYNTLQMNGL